VMRRQQLSETQIAALFDPTTDPRELVRHYTLSETDIAIIRRCRGDHSRLGYALMLCYLRHPGRPLRIGERPPAALVSLIFFSAGEQVARARLCAIGWLSSQSLAEEGAGERVFWHFLFP
jgi:hypothetical protein